MPLNSADHSVSRPHIVCPQAYNAAHDLLVRNAHHPDKAAFIVAMTNQCLTYSELADDLRLKAGCW
ncbi:MAG: hypothetical protein H7224_04485 [Polaromonas sp.]|nr:hypothetical protein [Polaromonas sp.]